MRPLRAIAATCLVMSSALRAEEPIMQDWEGIRGTVTIQLQTDLVWDETRRELVPVPRTPTEPIVTDLPPAQIDVPCILVGDGSMEEGLFSFRFLLVPRWFEEAGHGRRWACHGEGAWTTLAALTDALAELPGSVDAIPVFDHSSGGLDDRIFGLLEQAAGKHGRRIDGPVFAPPAPPAPTDEAQFRRLLEEVAGTPHR